MDRDEYRNGGASSVNPRGESLPQSKLTDEKVAEIRRLHRAKQDQIAALNRVFSAEALAKRFGVHVSTIEKVLSYETWRHVPD